MNLQYRSKLGTKGLAVGMLLKIWEKFVKLYFR